MAGNTDKLTKWRNSMAGNTDKLLKRHVFHFNEEDNGGESLLLITEVYANGDPDGIYYNQELSLQSYCNSASFHLSGATFTPDILRKLANELDRVEIEAKANIVLVLNEKKL